MARGGRRPGAGRKPGQLNKRTIEAVKFMGPVGERAIGVLVSAMEDRLGAMVVPHSGCFACG